MSWVVEWQKHLHTIDSLETIWKLEYLEPPTPEVRGKPLMILSFMNFSHWIVSLLYVKVCTKLSSTQPTPIQESSV